MAEQKSIVLSAVILAMVVAGGAFYFFMGTSDEEQLDENNNEAQGEVVIADELATQIDGVEVVSSEEQLGEEGGAESEVALSLSEEQVDVNSDATAGEPAVLGAETVEPTAETGVAAYMMALMGLAAVLGFTGLIVALRKQIISA